MTRCMPLLGMLQRHFDAYVPIMLRRKDITCTRLNETGKGCVVAATLNLIYCMTEAHFWPQN